MCPKKQTQNVKEMFEHLYLLKKIHNVQYTESTCVHQQMNEEKLWYKYYYLAIKCRNPLICKNIVLEDIMSFKITQA
jgi:hypothetical protein